MKVHHVLNHTSGLQNALSSLVQDNPMVLCDWEECLKRVAMVAPESEPGQQQLYHYLSYGWLCGGIIQHASKRKFQDILEEAMVHPLNVEGELYIGIPQGMIQPILFIFTISSLKFECNATYTLKKNSVESRLATLTLDTNDLNKLAEVSSPTSISSSSSPPMFQFDILAGLVPFFNTLNVRRAILPAANGHCSARALARYYAALLDGGVVPPPHSSLSQPPLGSHPHHPKDTTNKKYGGNKKDSKTNNLNDFKIFSSQKSKLHDSFLGIGDYENLVLPNGDFGLGFKRVCSKDGSLIGFGHSGLGGSTAYCDINNRFAISVTLNKLSFGSVTRDIIQFVCSELNIPVPEEYA
ncbi:putative carboxylesterase [Helianthus anomalus]